jgi:hypothetical protein
MVSGTIAIESPASALSPPSLRSALRALGRLGVEHLQRRDQQQHAAADLERGQRDAEELDDAQAGQGADGDDDEGADRRDADRPPTLLAAETACEMDEERNHADRIDDRQQREQRLQDFHRQAGAGGALRRVREMDCRRPAPEGRPGRPRRGRRTS